LPERLQICIDPDGDYVEKLRKDKKIQIQISGFSIFISLETRTSLVGLNLLAGINILIDLELVDV